MLNLSKNSKNSRRNKFALALLYLQQILLNGKRSKFAFILILLCLIVLFRGQQQNEERKNKKKLESSKTNSVMESPRPITVENSQETSHLPNENTNNRRPSLPEIALRYKTDKGPQAHNYTWIYEKYLGFWRDAPIRLLEVGLLQGASAMLWEDYFTNADLHFIDITEVHLIYKYKRSRLHLLDQSNKTQLADFAKEAGTFDVIIDDGGHTMEQQIYTFEAFFQLVRPGGLYVIEDLHTSYWREYGGKGTDKEPRTSSTSTINYLKDLVDSVNYAGALTRLGATGNLSSDVQARLDYYEKNINSMHFYNSICFIQIK